MEHHDFDLEGKSAITEWRVVSEAKSLRARDGRLSLVELRPRTGRYHQLRRHMAWACGCPLVGDATYGDSDESAERLRQRGLFLCSNGIEIEHPYYNTPEGRGEWIGIGAGRKERASGASLSEDEETGMVTVKARIDLPVKFESFLRRESSRASKFAD